MPAFENRITDSLAVDMLTHQKMLESQPEDALGSLVLTVLALLIVLAVLTVLGELSELSLVSVLVGGQFDTRTI